MTTILVVDDSRFVRTVVGDLLADAGFEVETAPDGRTAVDAVSRVDPHVVTMDVEMPGMGGIEAVERIAATNPTPIVMVSAHTDRGADATIEALARGAVDFVHKPDGSDSRNLADMIDAIVETVDALAGGETAAVAGARTSPTDPRTSPTAETAAAPGAETAARRSVAVASRGPDSQSIDSADDAVGVPAGVADDPTVVVGASTGGPRVVERLLADLPVELGAKLLVVQHMPAEFTARFARRLDSISSYEVREAGDGDRIGAGEALVAPGGRHLVVRANVGGRLRVGLDDGERVHGVRPAIDVAMRSAADRVSDPLAGVVLSGMGRDGAAGIEAIGEAGGATVAQDEATSPVFGIPKRAIETGRVDAVRPATEMASAVVDAFARGGGGDG